MTKLLVKKLTKVQWRIAIAKDVLARMRYRKIERRNYLKTYNAVFSPLADPQKEIKQLEKYCQVCALGACLLSHIKLYDKVTMRDLHVRASSDTPYLHEEDIVSLLQQTFPKRMMAAIEAAFEGEISPVCHIAYTTTSAWKQSTIRKAVAFGERYRDERKCLKAIMKNIIANEGNFKP